MNLRITNMSIIIIVMTLLAGCTPPQHRLNYDFNRNALVSCDERVRIMHVAIIERNGGDRYRIDLEQGKAGSSILYFDKANDGYYCNIEYPLIFKANTEYILSSTSFDSSLEMIVFTDAEGNIDSVANPQPCR